MLKANFRRVRRQSRFATVLVATLALAAPRQLHAQGVPVDMGSHIPVGIWFAGAAVLGVVLVYGIMRNRTRTRAEKQLSDQATRDLYAKEDRDAKTGTK